MTPRRIAVIGTGHTATGGTLPPATIANRVAPGITAELVETEQGVFPGTPQAREQTEREYIKTGQEAARAGYDAIFINTVGDYGLKELRSIVGIPVIGAGEAAMLFARALGTPFAIVTIWPPTLAFIYDGLIADYGMGEYCAGVRYAMAENSLDTLGDDDNFVEKMRRGDVDSLDNVIAHCHKALEAGARTIVMGCTCMAPIADSLAAACDAPVIEAMATGYGMTELALRQLNPGTSSGHT